MQSTDGASKCTCADGRISWATAGGRDGAAITCDGGESGEGGVRGVKWGGCWHNCSARVGGHGVVVGGSGEVEGAWHVCLARAVGMRW